jgi:hypothetical protein
VPGSSWSPMQRSGAALCRQRLQGQAVLPEEAGLYRRPPLPCQAQPTYRHTDLRFLAMYRASRFGRRQSLG